jgi:hypothetical protein
MKSIILTLADIGVGFLAWSMINLCAGSPWSPSFEQMAWYLGVLASIRYRSRGDEDA